MTPRRQAAFMPDRIERSPGGTGVAAGLSGRSGGTGALGFPTYNTVNLMESTQKDLGRVALMRGGELQPPSADDCGRVDGAARLCLCV
jgi:hypothetical protein